jgi:signal transduction histidine kinase
LATAREALEIVLDGMAGDIGEQQKKLLTFGKRSLDRLIRLVTDLLDLSKIEAGKMELQRESIDMASLIHEVLETYALEFSKKKITIESRISKNAGLVDGDRDKLIEVLTNLLVNAVKYTPAEGSITVELEETEREVCCRISDTGPGIPKEDFRKIFDKFERITTERQEGAGLGLPIAKDIVELHNGRMWVESEVGKGSQFSFAIPKNPGKER